MSATRVNKMRLLELFSGTESIGKVFKNNGWEVVSVDNNPIHKPTYCADMIDFVIDGSFDVIWASPPCTAFSVASIGRHWKQGKPSPEAKFGTKLLLKTFEIIMLIRPKFWFIENPRGMMRVLPVMDLLPKKTVTYCQYGDERMKPTDIWTNCDKWNARPPCKNGDPCHISAPRGSTTGTQGLNLIDRARLPNELCVEIFETVKGLL